MSWNQWKLLDSVFDQPRHTVLPPAAATHNNALYIAWQDRETDVLWWGKSGRRPEKLQTPTRVNKGAEISAMGPPSLIEVDNTLHLIVAQRGCGGYLFHWQFDDQSNRWLHRVGVGLTSEYAPALAAINGKLFCVARDASDANEDILRWTVWDPIGGWSLAQVVNAGTPRGPEPQMADAKPAFVQLRTQFHLMVPLGTGFVQLHFDIEAHTFTPVQPSIKEHSTTGCNGVGFPSQKYGFVAYAVRDERSVSVSQFNFNTWQVRESLEAETLTTPALAIIGVYIHCFWVRAQDGMLVHAARVVDTRTDDWMGKLSDKTPIYAISIPGTHDSAATKEFMSRSQAAWPWVETQKMNIPQQLNLGIRFLDLRLNLDDGNVLRMVHSKYGLGTTFADIFAALLDFLTENKSETILVTIKNDGNADAGRFEDAVGDFITGTQNQHHLWFDKDYLPTLKDCRGRIILFRRYPTPNARLQFGFDLSGNDKWPRNALRTAIPIAQNTTVVVQDNFDYMGTRYYHNGIILPKWKAVQDLLDEAQETSSDKRTLFLNFLSAAGAPLHSALDIATGGFYVPEDEENFGYYLGMNQRMWDYLDDNKGELKRLGVIIFDYPEVPAGDLINAVIDSNFSS